MKPIKSLFVLAIVCIPALASAQGYYNGRGGPPAREPGGFHHREGMLIYGAAIGFGGMNDGGSGLTDCGGCDVKPLAFEGDAHIGGMLSNQFGLMFEVQVNSQQVSADRFDNTFVTQGAAMIAAQYWVLPMLWIKGGIGFASLQVDDGVFVDDFGTGGAVMGAAGVELFSARNFALELQGRLINGSYNSLNDNITSGTIGIGINWF
jgi:hypothetical protein